MHLLIVEDEQPLALGLKRGLEMKGYAVDWLDDPLKAQTRILLYRNDYDLVIMDLMMPGLDGYEITRNVREEGAQTPIIVLTSIDQSNTKAELLNSGADDYMVKPFAFEELLARINSLLRRPDIVETEMLMAGELQMDTSKRVVKRNGEPIKLTLKEYSLLECFMRRPGETLSREDIFNDVWDFNSLSWSNVLDVHMKNLRKKLESEFGPRFETIRGVGYRLVT